MNSLATAPYKAGLKSPSVIDKFARSAILKMMAKLQYGRLILQEDEFTRSFGGGHRPQAHIIVRHPSFYRKCLFGGSIGAGEAYIENLWEVDDLTNLVRIMVLNMTLLDRMEKGLARILRPFDLISHLMKRNSRKGAKRNILAHYDLGNELYQSFLDPTMMYSSAIYPGEDSSLEEASLNKLDTVCKRLDLRPNDRVIEIGSGWGGFAIHAARHYGCHVTATTISSAQYEESEARIRQAGLSDQITLLNKDYRDLHGEYDKLVSIEMIEAVGHRFLPEFFEKCCSLLKPEGKMLLQAITISDQKYNQYRRSVDFIQRYIFPGGCLPSNSHMLNLIAQKTDMVVRSITDFGFDYAKTLKEWRQRFNRSFPYLRNKGYDDTFKRLWEFYFCYCEGGFLERSISVVHLVATRPENRR